MILDRPERLAPLVTTRVDLAGIGGAFAALTGGTGAIKALVKPGMVG